MEDAEAVRVGKASQHIKMNTGAEAPCMKPEAVISTNIRRILTVNNAAIINAADRKPSNQKINFGEKLRKKSGLKIRIGRAPAKNAVNIIPPVLKSTLVYQDLP